MLRVLLPTCPPLCSYLTLCKAALVSLCQKHLNFAFALDSNAIFGPLALGCFNVSMHLHAVCIPQAHYCTFMYPFRCRCGVEWQKYPGPLFNLFPETCQNNCSIPNVDLSRDFRPSLCVGSIISNKLAPTFCQSRNRGKNMGTVHKYQMRVGTQRLREANPHNSA